MMRSKRVWMIDVGMLISFDTKNFVHNFSLLMYNVET